MNYLTWLYGLWIFLLLISLKVQAGYSVSGLNKFISPLNG